VPSLIQVTPPSVVEWQSHLVDTEIAFNFSNTIYQVVAFTETISQPWNNNPLYLLMAYTSFVSAGAVPFFSVPIPNPPDCVNITFAVPLYQRPLVTDAMYIAISSTPLTYTATPRLSQIQVAGGSGSVAPI
jgi:hypothetical protein